MEINVKLFDQLVVACTIVYAEEAESENERSYPLVDDLSRRGTDDGQIAWRSALHIPAARRRVQRQRRHDPEPPTTELHPRIPHLRLDLCSMCFTAARNHLKGEYIMRRQCRGFAERISVPSRRFCKAITLLPNWANAPNRCKTALYFPESVDGHHATVVDCVR